jgi:hypothetical protein
VLELGKAGTAGAEKGVVPVLSDGALVATLRASNWREKASAAIGGRTWSFGRQRGGLTGRWEADPEGTARLRARQTSWWRGTWDVDLEGLPVEVVPASWWNGTHRFTTGGRPLAESGRRGWATRPTLTPAGDLALDHAVFLLWFELVLHRRNAAAAAA